MKDTRVRYKNELLGEDFEVSFHTRKVVQVYVRVRGKMVASGMAIQNPKDEFNEELGQKIALGRALTDIGVDQGHKKGIISSVMAKVQVKKGKEAFREFMDTMDACLAASLEMMRDFWNNQYDGSREHGSAARNGPVGPPIIPAVPPPLPKEMPF